ncbi:MAG: hypothetical protein WB239_08910 [Acidimicrobiia bacterium]
MIEHPLPRIRRPTDAISKARAEASAFRIMAGVGLVGIGMRETSEWSQAASRSTLVVVLYPLTLVFGHTALVNAVGEPN